MTEKSTAIDLNKQKYKHMHDIYMYMYIFKQPQEGLTLYTL